MISRDFIHEYDDICMIEAAYDDHMSEIGGIMAGLKIQKTRLDDMREYGLMTESAEEYFTESVASALTELGKKIIEIVDKIKTYITEFFSNLNPERKKAKEVERKLSELNRKDPGAAAQLTIYLKQGDITISDMKDIDEYFSNIDKILDDIKKSKIDPKSLKGKWEKVKKKVNDSNAKGGIAAVAAILGIAATATGLYLNWQKIGAAKSCKLIDASENTAKKAAVTADKIRESLNSLETIERGGSVNGVSGADISSKKALLAAIGADVDRRTKLQSKGLLNAFRNIILKADKFVTSKNGGRNRQTNIDSIRRQKTEELNRYEGVRRNNVAAARNIGTITNEVHPRQDPPQRPPQEVHIHNEIHTGRGGRNGGRGRNH